MALSSLLVFLDAFFLNQGVIAALIGAGLLFVGLPRAFLRKFAAIRSARLRNLGVYAMAVILVFALNGANNRMARHRAETLVAAVKAYHANHQRYPQSLDELVPEFVQRVPPAKYILPPFNRFYYFASERGASLFYVELPPFGRPTYSFSRDEWIYID